MTKNMKVKLDFNGEEEYAGKQTVNFLMNIGLDSDKYRKEDIDYTKLEETYIIEFKEKPLILKKLETEDIFDINIKYISEHGVSFYVTGMFGDGNIFVPTSNIECIHTITEQIGKDISFKNEN